MSGILISYRREDSAGHAGRLYDMLVEHFGADNVFMDVDTIAPGEDFVEVIRSAVSSAETVIALIGSQWLTVTSPGGQRRLDDPEDFVRLELVTALERNIRVVPVLVQGATMPGAKNLPAPLAPLARRNAVPLGDAHFRRDVQALIEALERPGGRDAKGRVRLRLARIRGSPLILAGTAGGLAVAGLAGWLISGGGRAPAGVEPTATTAPVTETTPRVSPPATTPPSSTPGSLAAPSPAPVSPTPVGSAPPVEPAAVSPSPESKPELERAAKTEPRSPAPPSTQTSVPPRITPAPSQLGPKETVPRQDLARIPRTVESRVAKKNEEPAVPAALPTPDPIHIQMLAERQLRDAGLLREGGTATDLGVTVNVNRDRTVTLTGVVRDAAQRDRATSLVRGIQGVVQVRANINVREVWR